MQQIFIDSVFYKQIQQLATAKRLTPNQFIAMALVNELGKKSNQAILRPETATAGKGGNNGR